MVTRLAILGGGPSALAAAYYLTSREPNAYDITIYETSWRLGGKTASGRTRDGRIQEHGMHVLFGCYHNVFDMMTDCYRALFEEVGVSTEEHRFQTFAKAVQPRHFGVIGDDRYQAEAAWLPWFLQFPSNHGLPGDPPLPTTFDLALTAVQVFIEVFLGHGALRFFHEHVPWLFGYHRRRERPPREGKGGRGSLGGDFVVHVLLWAAQRLMDNQRMAGRLFQRAIKGMQWCWKRVQGVLDHDLLSRGAVGRAWTTVDFFLAIVRGLIDGRVFASGSYDDLDGEDLRAWLARHGADQDTCDCPLVRIVYDAAFSYPDGGVTKESPTRLAESMAAGTALRIMVLMAFTYKNAFYYKMRAGMGDIIHAPLYEVLKHRNVKFKFFHRVTSLHPARVNGRDVIQRVELAKLARLNDRRPQAEYDPLEVREQLLTWPAEPLLDQIDPEDHQAACTAERGFIDLPTGPDRTVTLELERDFDHVLFGMPVATIPYVCRELVQADPPIGLWSRQPELATVQTMALQLWMKPALTEMGWQNPAPLLSLFHDPLNTWCDMGQVLAQEGWQQGAMPGSLAYLCGPLPHLFRLPDPHGPLSSAEAESLRARADLQARQASFKVLGELSQLWPRAFMPAESPGEPPFNFSLLVDRKNRKGLARFEAQYVRANWEPSERCTLALPGQTGLRIPAEDSGYDNLSVTGDWIRNGVHAACFEGAVQSGIRAARAISANKALYTIEAEALLKMDPIPFRKLREQQSSSRSKPPIKVAAHAAAPLRVRPSRIELKAVRKSVEAPAEPPRPPSPSPPRN
jgi:uncharacterized protein with NAD-binding domain and iron-sulfur cluster